MSREQQGTGNPIGTAFRAARMKLGLTQADAAERVGMATDVYGRIERGLMRPSIDSFRRGCVTLGVDPALALGLAGESVVQLQAPKDEDSPAVRRLARRARKLPSSAVDVLNRVAQALMEKGQLTDEAPEEES